MTKTLNRKQTSAGVSLPSPKAASHDWIVLGYGQAFQNRFEAHKLLRQVSKKDDLSAAISQSSANSIWIVTNESWADHLLKATSDYSLKNQRKASFGDLILCKPPRYAVLPSLHAIFRRVIGEVSSFKMLPPEQLAEVLASDNRADLFIGGTVDIESGLLTLARGDLQMLTVPLSIFHGADDSRPDFNDFALDDFGQAVAFGNYEASAHSILYGRDASYRRRINKQRTAEEKGFGASLRRLRLHRGLRQDELRGVPSKTIARIERGETEKPHGDTLARIAKALAVSAEEIEEY